MQDMSDLGLPNFFTAVPNKAMASNKVPSIYNAIMEKMMGTKNVIVVPKVEIFDLTSEDKAAYEALMLKISENSDKYHFVKSSDHWTKDGDLMRSIDYVEFRKIQVESKDKEVVPTTDKEIEKDLKDKLDTRHKEVQEELLKTEDAEKKKMESEEEAKKIEEAISERELDIEEVVNEKDKEKESPPKE